MLILAIAQFVMPSTPWTTLASLGDSIVDDLTGGGIGMGRFACFIVRFFVNRSDTCTITCVDSGYGTTTLPARPFIDNGIGRRLIDGEGHQTCWNWLCFCLFCCIFVDFMDRPRVSCVWYQFWTSCYWTCLVSFATGFINSFILSFFSSAICVFDGSEIVWTLILMNNMNWKNFCQYCRHHYPHQ